MTHLRNAFLSVKWLPNVQVVRFRRRINIQRPREPHYERARVIDVCKPFFAQKTKIAPMYELCEKPNESQKHNIMSLDNPYFKFLARDLMNYVNNSALIAFLHTNSVTAEERFKVTVALKKQNMSIKMFNRNIVRLAIENTKYEAIKPLFESHSVMVFSPEPHVKKLLKILRKAPHLVLLAGIVDGQLLSRPELVRYSQLPDLPAVQAGLVSVINMLSSQLVSSLTANQQALVRHLQHHVELLQTPPDEGPTPPPPPVQ